MAVAGARLRELGWSDVGGIMQRVETIIGTAFCAPFRTREGWLQAAKNLVQIQATQLAAHSVEFLIEEAGKGSATGPVIGLQGGHIKVLLSFQ
jgi:6-phosphofructokinase 1